MLFTLSGIVILVRALLPKNAYPPMLVSPLGRVTLVRAAQPSNARQPMSVTVSGMSMLTKFTQPRNAVAPIVVTVAGRDTEVTADPAKPPSPTPVTGMEFPEGDNIWLGTVTAPPTVLSAKTETF
jgi:hypothetical protein